MCLLWTLCLMSQEAFLVSPTSVPLEEHDALIIDPFLQVLIPSHEAQTGEI